MTNIFETASRMKLRFPSTRGDLTSEQLWDLGLNDLDHSARTVNTELKHVTEESFIATKPHPDKPRFELQLEILKHVIKVKQSEIEAEKERSERSEKRRKLVEALAVKEDEALNKKSRATLLKELEALDE